MTDPSLDQIQQQLNTPELKQAYQQTVAQFHKFKSGGPMPSQLLNQLLQRFGITLPKDYEIGTNKKTGQIEANKLNYWDRNSDWLPAALITAPFAISALAAPAAGAPAAAAPELAGPAAIAPEMAGPAAAAPVLSEAGDLASATPYGATGPGIIQGSGLPSALSSHSIWSTIANLAIPAAGNLIGAKIAANSNDKAAQIAAQSQDKALALLKEQYEQQRKDLGPYRNTGYGAQNALNFGTGLPQFEMPRDTPATAPPVDTSNAPHGTNPNNQPPIGTAVPRATLANPTGLQPGQPQQQAAQAQTQSGYVNIRSPQGDVRPVPIDQAQRFISAGGVAV